MHNPCPLSAKSLQPYKTVGTVSDLDTLQQLLEQPALLEGCDIVEFRLSEHTPLERSLELLPQMNALRPTLLTIRTCREGGTWDISDAERHQLFLAFAGKVSAMDLECDSELLHQYFQPGIYGEQTLIIASHHNFERCVEVSELEEKLAKARQHGADLLKMAVIIDEEEELQRLKDFCVATDFPLSLLGMGKLSLRSRIELPQTGSLLTYGYIDKPAAPQQPSCLEIKKALSGN